ncbi:MAG: LysM peptidoglycan-binding domain-containing protein [Ruminococcaceae bacterium]|nr:LysM peptidoglycan-binding domain-containing protein [Oscillospiraceae bacterium]
MTIHVVSAGETVDSIAGHYGVSPRLLRLQNQLPEAGQPAVGQALVVLFPTRVHTVAAGESLFGIARRYGTTVCALLRNNYFLHGQSALTPGQELVISLSGARQGALAVNGYAYPFIPQWVLEQQMPYLTGLVPFTYGITAEGGLVPLGDRQLLDAASRFGVTPWMHLSTLTEAGLFSSPLARQLLADPERQALLIQRIGDTMRDKGYRGLDVDFEYLPGELAQAYAGFIAALRQYLAPQGWPVLAALAPKVSGDQMGSLYEGHDYPALGAAADAVLLMTYEWGYTYGPPMAVSPMSQVRQVLDYALSVIPAEKLYLGVPTYGYDWPLPYEQGVTRASSLSPQAALTLARQHGAEIQYDPVAQAPWFRYRAGGQDHEVWFEDARSAAAKLALASDSGLRGVGLWNLMRLFPQLYLILNDQYNISE